MIRSRAWVMASLCAVAAVPIIIGSSCPPPADPFYIAVTPNRLNISTQIPQCNPGFVCISVVNTACVDAEVSLFIHDGYDLNLTYCNWTPPTQVWFPEDASQYCPGYNVGEFQLARPDLFTAAFNYPIQGQGIRLLKPRESLQVRIQDASIKSFGIEVARPGELPATPEIIDGPKYRCTMVNLGGNIRVTRSPEHVPTGETFQFVIYDLNNCALPGLAQFATRTGTSSGTGCPAVR
ncbi:MAG TPA: hypothetical protein VLM89_05230 [Phycisphaerae bacterium]|nr:hypothetical protein [Phycisphaerae bacterium]